MSRNEEFENGHRPWTNPLGLEHGPGKPVWDSTHQGLVKEALYSWVGSPDWMSLHMENVKANAPAVNAQAHGAAHALLTELWDNPQQHPHTLYRGARPDEEPGIKSYSERPHIAKKWAKQYGGQVVSIKAPVGVQMEKYAPGSDLNYYERQWVVDETDPRNKR